MSFSVTLLFSQCSLNRTVFVRLARSVMRVLRWTTRPADPGEPVSSASGMSKMRTKPSRRANFYISRRRDQHLRYVILCGAKHVGSANTLSLGEAQSFQAPVDINPRSIVEPGPGPGSARQNVGCRTGGHQERGNETEGRRGEETGEGGQEKCVPAPRRRYGLTLSASGQFAYMVLGQ